MSGGGWGCRGEVFGVLWVVVKNSGFIFRVVGSYGKVLSWGMIVIYLFDVKY